MSTKIRSSKYSRAALSITFDDTGSEKKQHIQKLRQIIFCGKVCEQRISKAVKQIEE